MIRTSLYLLPWIETSLWWHADLSKTFESVDQKLLLIRLTDLDRVEAGRTQDRTQFVHAEGHRSSFLEISMYQGLIWHLIIKCFNHICKHRNEGAVNGSVERHWPDRHVLPGGEPEADPKHAGETMLRLLPLRPDKWKKRRWAEFYLRSLRIIVPCCKSAIYNGGRSWLGLFGKNRFYLKEFPREIKDG